MVVFYDKLGHKARTDYFIRSASNVLDWILKASKESRTTRLSYGDKSPPDLAQTGKTYRPSTYATSTHRHPIEMITETPHLCPPPQAPTSTVEDKTQRIRSLRSGRTDKSIRNKVTKTTKDNELRVHRIGQLRHISPSLDVTR